MTTSLSIKRPRESGGSQSIEANISSRWDRAQSSSRRPYSHSCPSCHMVYRSRTQDAETSLFWHKLKCKSDNQGKDIGREPRVSQVVDTSAIMSDSDRWSDESDDHEELFSEGPFFDGDDDNGDHHRVEEELPAGKLPLGEDENHWGFVHDDINDLFPPHPDRPKDKNPNTLLYRFSRENLSYMKDMLREDIGLGELPSLSLLKFQRVIQEKNRKPLQCRKVYELKRKEQNKCVGECHDNDMDVTAAPNDINWVHVARLYGFATNNYLSRRAGSDMIEMLDSLTEETFGTGKKIPLMQWRSINDSCERGLFDSSKKRRGIHTLRSVSLPFDVRLFGKEELTAPLKGQNRPPLKKTVGVALNVLQRISEFTLKLVDPSTDIILKPMAGRSDLEFEGSLFSSFATGNLFRRCNDVVEAKHGPAAVAIILALYCDGTTIDEGRRKSAKPVSLAILNCATNVKMWFFIGYCPEKLAYSKKIQQKILQLRARRSASGIPKYMIADILQLAIRQVNRQFFHELMKPLIPHLQSGVMLQYGDNPKNVYQTILLWLSMSADTPAYELIGGTTYSCVKYSCGICCRYDCRCTKVETEFDKVTFKMPKTKYRGDNTMNDKAKKLEDALCAVVELLVGPSRPNAHQLKERKSIYQTIKKDCKLLNIYPGPCVLISEGHFNYAVENKLIHGMHEIFRIDHLHNFAGFLQQDVAANTLGVVTFMDGKSKDPKYTGCMGVLDSRVIKFSRLMFGQTLEISRYTNFPYGASVWYKAESENATASSGLLSSLENWKIRQLMVCLIFCLGLDGSILPNSDQWVEDRYECDEEGEQMLSNVCAIVMGSLTSALEASFYAKATALSQSGLKLYAQVLANARCHWQNLLSLRRMLIGSPFRRASGIKAHTTCAHLPHQVSELGMWPQAFDTEAPENTHMMFAKDPFSASSKRNVTLFVEMTKQVLRQERAVELLLRAKHETGKIKKPTYKVENCTSQVSFVNMKFQTIKFVGVYSTMGKEGTTNNSNMFNVIDDKGKPIIEQPPSISPVLTSQILAYYIYDYAVTSATTDSVLLKIFSEPAAVHVRLWRGFQLFRGRNVRCIHFRPGCNISVNFDIKKDPKNWHDATILEEVDSDPRNPGHHNETIGRCFSVKFDNTALESPYFVFECQIKMRDQELPPLPNFFVRADSCFRMDSSKSTYPLFSFVVVQFLGVGPPIVAQVLAIVSAQLFVKDKNGNLVKDRTGTLVKDKITHLVLVAEMQIESRNNKSVIPYPYPIYKYKTLVSGGLSIECIRLGNIIGSVCVLPNDTGRDLELSSSNYKSLRFFVIEEERIWKRNYNETYKDLRQCGVTTFHLPAEINRIADKYENVGYDDDEQVEADAADEEIDA